MKKLLGLGAVVLLCSVLAAGAAQGGRQGNAVKLTFATYVWQPTTVTATKNIVEAWNKSHPGIQVEIVPVDVNSVHDKLLTSFVGGTAADIIHDEAADIAGFTQQGYLANLTPLLPKSLKSSIPKSILNTVNYGGKITGVPSLLQTYNVFANISILKSAGIKAPTLADPWTWADFRAAAKKLTNSDRFGVCWGLRSPTAAIQTMSLNYGGQFFYLEKGKWEFKLGPNDQNVVRQMHDMIHVDKSVDPAATGLSGSAVLPAFFGGKCAMTVQGNFQAQSMILQSPRGFNWAMLPLLKGRTQEQVANPQTFSISQQSKNKQAAMQFIAYLLNPQNMAKLALGDWLIPANPEAGKIARRSTKRTGSWRIATSSVVHFRKGNWVSLNAYPRWKAEVAQPAFVQYLRGSISLQELSDQLGSGWTRVRG
ncbi:MAG: sugar ABC transporter substrate-binding protein [Actinobacteria bacterium]|nr:sugar ABC transporter substrate-binding protein [Actinomycetota bacterium]